ncbi:septation protein SepH, partial [Actinoallomurus oryzae]|uniref:septation protein SepH n=1 Tax=Actinoallomurus oryzae TaxID=502180 RepID=UPI0031EA31F9
MQELRLVAVSEDGSYLVLATAGRGTRFTLPVDDRLRAAVRGHFSRLGQYEIEVESPLRPKEIQARIRAGETAEEIAETAGIPVERVRWFEGPVLQEREYMAQQAQRVTIRRQGESAPAPALGEIVEERLGKRGIDLEEVEWDSRKCEDSTWRVRLSFSYDGRPYAAEWAYDPRRRHISAVNEEAAQLSSLELDDPVDDIVTPFVPRRAMKVVTEPVREEAPPAPMPAPAPAPREEPPVAEEPAFVREVPRQEVPRPEPEEPRETGLSRTPSQRETAPAREETAPREVAPREVTPREAVPPSPQETQRETAREAAPPSSPAEPRETTPARPRETDPAEPR